MIGYCSITEQINWGPGVEVEAFHVVCVCRRLWQNNQTSVAIKAQDPTVQVSNNHLGYWAEIFAKAGTCSLQGQRPGCGTTGLVQVYTVVSKLLSLGMMCELYHPLI